MAFCRIELLGPPVAKGRPRAVRRGNRIGTYTPRKTEDYEANLQHEAKVAMAGAAPAAGALKVVITAYVAIPTSLSKKARAAAIAGELRPTKKPDLDNYEKTIDALNGVVFVDDSQVVEKASAKFYSERPRLVIVVTEL